MVGKPKAFELDRGRQPGDPDGFEPSLPVWRKPGAGRAVPQTEALPTLYRYIGSLTHPT